MKKIFFAIVASAFLFSSCGNSADKKTNTHTHEDGSEHINHDNNTHDEAPEQEVFELNSDPLHTEKDTMKSKHESAHSHSHEDGHEHTH